MSAIFQEFINVETARFESSGIFNWSNTIKIIYYILVGGGGGGGGGVGSLEGGQGGGGGDVLAGFMIPSNDLIITIGQGGSGGAYNANGTDGTASIIQFDSTIITAYPGRGGAPIGNTVPLNGFCSGGAGNQQGILAEGRNSVTVLTAANESSKFLGIGGLCTGGGIRQGAPGTGFGSGGGGLGNINGGAGGGGGAGYYSNGGLGGHNRQSGSAGAGAPGLCLLFWPV